MEKVVMKNNFLLQFFFSESILSCSFISDFCCLCICITVLKVVVVILMMPYFT